MTFFDEFDLDLVRTKGNSGAVGPQGVSADISLAISTIISGSVVTGCSDECIISKTCSDGCSDNCTSATSCGCNVTVNL